MQDFGFALLLIGYVWSVASGGRRSIPCALPLGAGLAYLGGGSVFG